MRKRVIYELKVDLKYHPGFLLLSIDRHHLSRFLPPCYETKISIALAKIFNEYLIQYHTSYMEYLILYIIYHILCYVSGSLRQRYQVTLAKIYNDLNIWHTRSFAALWAADLGWIVGLNTFGAGTFWGVLNVLLRGNRQIISFQNMCDMLDKNWQFGQENRFFAKKHTSKSPFLVATNLGYLILEGPGWHTVDTRSTSGLPLETWGYDESN